MHTRDELLAGRLRWIAARKREGVEGVYKAQALALPLPPSLQDALRVPRGERAIIGSIDRSLQGACGELNPGARAALLTELGCTAVMVSTDATFRQGSYQDLLAAAQATRVPVICGDYVLDPLQIAMARAHGAAAVVLSTALVEERALRALFRTAIEYGLDVLFDVASAKDVEAVGKLRAGRGPAGVPRLFATDIWCHGGKERARMHERVVPAYPDDSLGVFSLIAESDQVAAEISTLGYEVVLVDGSAPDVEVLRALLDEYSGQSYVEA